MDTQENCITPEDYIDNGDGRKILDPFLEDRLQSEFVAAIAERVKQMDWIMRIIHEKFNAAAFPGLCVIPPDQQNSKFLNAYRIEAGVPEELEPEYENEEYLPRHINIYSIKERAFAGPVDFHMPAIMSERKLASFVRSGPGSYDPYDWAWETLLFVKALHKEKGEQIFNANRELSLTR